MRQSLEKPGIGGSDCANWTAVIADDLKLVESVLRDATDSQVPQFKQASSNLIEGGGKRLRPSLVLLWARLYGIEGGREELIQTAAAVELIHMATLMHDDVIDRSDLRRGRRTANASWGNKLSILTGDYILSKAFQILVGQGDMRVLQLLPQVTASMSESEALQALNERNIEGWSEYYSRIIHGKTAGFIGACCEIGAVLSGADSEKREIARNYGENLGMAFQITDDILDLAGSSSSAGKPVSGDLRDGKITLPVLLTLECCTPEERRRLSALISSSDIDDDIIQEVRTTAINNGGISKTQDAAAEHIKAAIESLSKVQSSAEKDSLFCLAEQILIRTF